MRSSDKQRERIYNRNAYLRKISQGRCGHCGDPLEAGYAFRTCLKCRDYLKQYAALWRKSKRDAKDEPLSSEVSREVGCGVCGLRGEHVCLRGDATRRREWV